jgi:chaperonin GroEL
MVKKVIVTKDDTILIEGQGDKKLVKDRVHTIKEQIKTASSDYEKEKLQERLGKLTGGVAVLKVGGASETEVNELKDRIDDAICATKAAAAEGIVPGGGCALLYASKVLKGIKLDNFDQQNGLNIVAEAIKQPLIAICNNAGISGSLVANQLLEQNDENLGMDAQVGEKCDMIKKGIIDPTKVVRSALVGAVRVASLMLTTEAMVVDEVKKEDKKSKAPTLPDDMDY